jgi:glycine/D-amino acid oxidase-like deaminating enzyme
MEKFDLIIIGGGIMGLMTAYFTSRQNLKVTILEKSCIGNKQAASFSYTRSIRNDYLDPLYSTLAFEAQKLWKDLEEYSDEKFFIKCGCLNLVRRDVTPKVNDTYALKSYKNLSTLKMNAQRMSKIKLQVKFPQFEADLGSLDMDAGFLYLPQITKTILKLLKKNGVTIKENVDIQSINELTNQVEVRTNQGKFNSNQVVITAGGWTNQILEQVINCKQQFPISWDKPSQCKYFIPKSISQFTPNVFPVFAYLDVGIYGHPVYPGKTKGIKISFYDPPDIKKVKDSKIQSVEDFVNLCIPSLKNAQVLDVDDADQCSYDMVSDKNFIIGKLPNFNRIYVGTGWNGTGYKFAPLVGKILSELITQGKTTYQIDRFSPERFNKL